MDAKYEIVAAVIVFALFVPFTATAALRVGDQAPDFSLPDQNGKSVRLSDFRGKKNVVLAFYVRANTPT